MRLDAHQHFWHYTAEEYSWINEDMKVIRQSFLPQDLQPLLALQEMDGVVAVQARNSLEETEWLLKLSDQYDFIHGVVGWVDVCAADLPIWLKRFARHPKFKGVRYGIQGEPDGRIMQRPDFLRGIESLQQFALAFDLLLFPRHLPYAVELVQRFPLLSFVLDHMAKPDIKGDVLHPWKGDIEALAANSNVSCKLSGMVTEADWAAWHESDFRPYLDTVFAAFGTKRLMIGSDWPVCLVAGSYVNVLDIVKNYMTTYSIEDQERVLGGNCAEFYRIS